MKEPAVVAVVLLVPVFWLGIEFVTSRMSGWRDLRRHYAGDLPPKEAWILRETTGGVPTDAPVLAMNGIEYDESSMKIGASETGLHLAEPLLHRLFRPTLFIPWKDVTDAWLTERTPGLPPGYVRLSFAATPKGYIYIDWRLAQDLKERSKGKWQPQSSASWKPNKDWTAFFKNPIQ